MKTTEINEISTEACYEGYLWMSNADEAIEYHYDKPVDRELFNSSNPFVREGYLYNKGAGVSLTIKCVDGHYLIRKYEVAPTDFDSASVDELSFVSNRMSQRFLKFLRYWKAVDEPACLGLPVMVFDRMVFVGFDN